MITPQSAINHTIPFASLEKPWPVPLSLSLVIRLRCVGTTFWLSLRCSSIIITTLAMVVIIEHAQRTKSSCVVPNGNVSEI